MADYALRFETLGDRGVDVPIQDALRRVLWWIDERNRRTAGDGADVLDDPFIRDSRSEKLRR